MESGSEEYKKELETEAGFKKDKRRELLEEQEGVRRREQEWRCSTETGNPILRRWVEEAAVQQTLEGSLRSRSGPILK